MFLGLRVRGFGLPGSGVVGLECGGLHFPEDYGLLPATGHAP